MGEHFDADLEAAGWFFENSLDIFMVIHDLKITRINPAWTAITGWSAEETIGKTLYDFRHPDDTDLFDACRDTLTASRRMSAEHRLLAKSGAWLWVRTRVKLTDPRSFICVTQDITEDHQRAVESEEARRAADLLRESAGITVWRYEPDQDLYEFDPDFSRPIRAVVEGPNVRARRSVQDVIHRDDADTLDRVWRHTLSTGEPGSVEYRNRRADKTWARLRTAWRGIRPAPSGKWEIVGITQDVTELAETRDAALRGQEAANAAAEAKSQFLANMSHEIRTPMNGVLGVLHLLKSENLSEDGRRLLGEALACGAMLAELLNDVIDFSKIEAGRLELAPEPVNLPAALDGVVGLLRSQAEIKGLYLRGETDPSLGWISADPVRLRQMLFNLIGNAVKFTLEGGIDVRLLALEGQRLRIEVRDTGIGIPEAARARLFARFNQADNSMTRRFGGSGLGLAITQRLTEMMGGEIGFDSVEGQGSTFWIEVPFEAAEAPVITGEEEVRWLDQMRVLVVEDNPTNRLIATKLLENLGAVVETADDGAQGVDAAQRSAFDLIFMDIQMPVMDGVSAAKAIRALPGPIGETPILAMTANALSHQIESYRAAGMNGSVAKPISPSALLGELARIAQANEDEAPEAMTA